MAVRIGINGFGRLESHVVGLNHPADARTLAHLLVARSL
jgi:hypothetical protein